MNINRYMFAVISPAKEIDFMSAQTLNVKLVKMDILQVTLNLTIYSQYITETEAYNLFLYCCYIISFFFFSSFVSKHDGVGFCKNK